MSRLFAARFAHARGISQLGMASSAREGCAPDGTDAVGAQQTMRRKLLLLSDFSCPSARYCKPSAATASAHGLMMRILGRAANGQLWKLAAKYS